MVTKNNQLIDTRSVATVICLVHSGDKKNLNGVSQA